MSNLMKNNMIANSNYYTEPLHFVLIHLETTNTASALSEKTHVHAIKQKALISICKEKSEPIIPPIPPHTIIQYGSFDDMRNGHFDSGINERFRAQNIGGHYGLASRSIKHNQEYLLNDEAMIYDNISYYGDINGKA